jgi:hypothetical protein
LLRDPCRKKEETNINMDKRIMKPNANFGKWLPPLGKSSAFKYKNTDIPRSARLITLSVKEFFIANRESVIGCGSTSNREGGAHPAAWAQAAG